MIMPTFAGRNPKTGRLMITKKDLDALPVGQAAYDSERNMATVVTDLPNSCARVDLVEVVE